MADQQLELILKAVDRTEAAFKAVEKNLNSVARSSKKTASETEKQNKAFDVLQKRLLKLGAAYLVVRKGLQFFTSSLEAQAKQEAAVNQLNLALANQGILSAETSRSLQDYAASLQKVTTFGDEVIIQAEAQLAAFGMNEEQIRKSTQVALDFAAATGRNLTDAANAVGKAFAGQTDILREIGITIDKSVPPAQQFEQALAALEGRFGGSARAAVETYAGQLAQLKNAYGDVKEAVGKFLQSLINLGQAGKGGLVALEWLRDFFGKTLVKAFGETRAAFSELIAFLFNAIARVGELLDKVPGFGGTVDSAAWRQMAIDMQAHAITMREQAHLAAEATGNFQDFSGQVREAAAAVEGLSEEEKKAAEAAKKLAAAMAKWRIERTNEYLEKLKERMVGMIEAAEDARDAEIDFSEILGIEEAEAELAGLEEQAKRFIDDLHDEARRLEHVFTGLALVFGAINGNLEATVGIIQNMARAFKDAVTEADRFHAIASAIGQIGGQIGGRAGGAIQGAAGGAMTGFALGGPLGAAVGGIAGGIAGLFGGGGRSPEEQVNDLRDAFFEAHGGWLTLQRELAKATTEDLVAQVFNARTVDAFNAAVQRVNETLNLQAQAEADLQAAIEKYGFSVEELGPKWRQQELDKMAAQLLKDYQLLIASGIDQGLVIDRMADSMNEYIQTAIRSGVSIPMALRPQVEKMIEMGLLLDENGNAFSSAEEAGITFAESLTEGLSRAIDAIERLVAALTGIAPVTIPVNVEYHDPGYPGEPRGRDRELARGGVVVPFRPRNAQAGAVIHAQPGGELVRMGEAGQAELAAPVDALLSRMQAVALEAAGGGQTVVIELDGQKVAQALVRRNRSGLMPVRAGSVRRY